MPQNTKTALIIGAGPAGLTAAVNAAHRLSTRQARQRSASCLRKASARQLQGASRVNLPQQSKVHIRRGGQAGCAGG